jgi:hypothetical protein
MATRNVMQSMIKSLKKTGEYVDSKSLKNIGKINTSIQERYCLVLEQKALDENKIDLQLCKGMLGAKFLICEVLKNKRLRSTSIISSLASSLSSDPSLNQNEGQSMFLLTLKT